MEFETKELLNDCYIVIFQTDMCKENYQTGMTMISEKDFDSYMGFYTYLMIKYGRDDFALRLIMGEGYNESSDIQRLMSDFNVAYEFNLPINDYGDVGYKIANHLIWKVKNGIIKKVELKNIDNATMEEDITNLNLLKRRI